jgi:hypothetical protein
MTSMMLKPEILKQDRRGRVHVPVPRREALLDEFEKTGVTGAKFAQLAGIKYATFAGWVRKRRKQRGKLEQKPACSPNGGNEAVVRAGPMRLFEALVEGEREVERKPVGARGLVVQLPGGSRILIDSPAQLQMAAELVGLIAQNAGGRC